MDKRTGNFLSMNREDIFTRLNETGWAHIILNQHTHPDRYLSHTFGALQLFTFGFKSEQLGDLVYVLSPCENQIQSRKKLRGHTDASFLPFEKEWVESDKLSVIPNYIALYSVTGASAGTTVCHIEDLIFHLTRDEIGELCAPNFIFNVQKSFCLNKATVPSRWRSILDFSEGACQVRFSHSIKTYRTEKAKKCALKLSSIYQNFCHKIVLKTRELLIIDNRKSIHGRDFISKDNADRTLHRYYLYKTNRGVIHTSRKGIILP